jgi:membrane protein DedA with SNARE-associated domain
MDPVSWLENVAEGSPVILLILVMLALFLDSLAVLGALLPGDLLLLVPSAAVGLPGSLIVVLGGVLGTVLGYTVSYGVGRRAGPAIRNSWLGKRVGEHRWVQAERILRGPAGRALALVQFMPILNYLVPLLAGTLEVPLKRFVQLTSTGAVLYCSLYAFLGWWAC